MAGLQRQLTCFEYAWSLLPAAVHQRFVKIVVRDPKKMELCEQLLKNLSYVLPGWLPAADEFAELLFSASKLTALVTDTIIRRITSPPSGAHPITPKEKLFEHFITTLSVFDSCDVVLEMLSRLHSPRLKWTAIYFITLSRVVCRSLLLFQHGYSLLPSPPLSPLDRRYIDHCVLNDSLTCFM